MISIKYPYQERVNLARSLFGVLPSDMTLEDARNAKDYVKSPVAVYEPSAFLKLSEAEKEIK